MDALAFSKYHGLGNDFVVVDALGTGDLISSEQARLVCDRHRGVGADGVLTLLPSRDPAADARLHIWNSDGSVAQMCGNGLRCVVAYMAKARVVLDTDAGLRSGELRNDGLVRVSLGKPDYTEELLEVRIGEKTFRGLQVDMGNPHYVLEVFEPDVDLLKMAQAYGQALEHHSAFPDRSNIEFLSWREGRLAVVVHERGVGITQACGTGAGASYIAAKHWGYESSKAVLAVDLLGGSLDVDESEDEVFILGDGIKVFSGELTLEE